ncbi:MAG TPA: hypothetical protein VLA34_08625, partial [Candidatus Krumholzibacterium sp.]|nr:hypothetical protein [Candidatus Krumholzibacterium sp.]
MNGPPVITGIRADAITLMIRTDILLRAFGISRNPLAALKVLRELIRLRKTAGGGRRPRKYFRIGRSYHWGLNAPGWPSKSFSSFVDRELSSRLLHEGDKRHL